jgi:hypothetical protein
MLRVQNELGTVLDVEDDNILTGPGLNGDRWCVATGRTDPNRLFQAPARSSRAWPRSCAGNFDMPGNEEGEQFRDVCHDG